jgi:hypothetical protein
VGSPRRYRLASSSENLDADVLGDRISRNQSETVEFLGVSTLPGDQQKLNVEFAAAARATFLSTPIGSFGPEYG